MKKLIISILFLCGISFSQTYSKLNYTEEVPNNVAEDNKLIDIIEKTIDNHYEGELSVFIRYTYTEIDSSFEIPDVDDSIIRVFVPAPFPDGATELERSNEVIVFEKHSPLKKGGYIGGDASLPPKQMIKPVNQAQVNQAKKKAVELKGKVSKLLVKNQGKDIYYKNKKTTKKGEQRKAAWRVATKKEAETAVFKKKG